MSKNQHDSIFTHNLLCVCPHITHHFLWVLLTLLSGYTHPSVQDFSHLNPCLPILNCKSPHSLLPVYTHFTTGSHTLHRVCSYISLGFTHTLVWIYSHLALGLCTLYLWFSHYSTWGVLTLYCVFCTHFTPCLLTL